MNRKHIIFISLLQLIVFLTPLAVKDFHIHIHLLTNHTNSISFNKTEKSCAICNFEFVKFIAENPIRNQHHIQVISILITYNLSQYCNTIYYSYNLRGPPEF